MNNEYYKKIAEALQQMNEKKKLDPVDDKELKGTHSQRKDKDIDNDGDVDSSDEYLHKRRATIKKKMKHSMSGKLGHKDKDIEESADEMDECPECGGSTENHEPDCSRAKAAKRRKIDDDKDLDAKSAGKALKHDCATHVTSEQWGYGECISGQHTLEEQADGTGIVTHYDVMFEHGIEQNVAVEDLTILREKSHLHAAKKKVSESVFSDDKRKEHQTAADHHRDQASHHETEMNKAKKSGAHPSEYDHHKVLAKMHAKAQVGHTKALQHSRNGSHDQARSHSQIAHGHSDAVKKKAATYESVVYENRAKHVKGASKEGPLDKYKRSYNDGMEKSKVNQMAQDAEADNPKHADITPEEEGHNDAVKAGRVTKQAKSRGNDNLSNGDKTPPKAKGAK